LTQQYGWRDIQKITYEGRVFIIHVVANDKKLPLGYRCDTSAAVHCLWKTAIEQKYFFTLTSSSDVPAVTAGGGLFRKNVKVRYRSVMFLVPHVRLCFLTMFLFQRSRGAGAAGRRQ
jgi:hypothetical protein